MKMRVCTAFAFLTLLLVALSPVATFASTLEGIVEESLYDTLREEGIGDLVAGKISERYVFMGSVMINKVQLDDGEALFNQAQLTGQALGAALATSYLQYGESALQETASVMMLSARAGVAPDAAAAAFSMLAQSGYAFDASIKTMHSFSEIVRLLKPNDGGASICLQISGMVREQVSVGKLHSEMLSIADGEKNRQRRLISLKDAERKKEENRGGGERAASASKGDNSGSSSSSGGASSAGGSSGGSSASGAGKGDSQGSDSSSSENDSGSASGSNDSSSDSGADGGSDAGAEGAGSGGSGSSDSNASENDKSDQVSQ